MDEVTKISRRGLLSVMFGGMVTAVIPAHAAQDNWSDYIGFDADNLMNDSQDSSLLLEVLDDLWLHSSDDGEHSFRNLLRKAADGNAIFLSTLRNSMTFASEGWNHKDVNIAVPQALETVLSIDGQEFLPSLHRKLVHELWHLNGEKGDEPGAISRTNETLRLTFGNDVIMRDPNSHGFQSGFYVDINLDSLSIDSSLKDILLNPHGTPIEIALFQRTIQFSRRNYAQSQTSAIIPKNNL